jgi:hypothetical protein
MAGKRGRSGRKASATRLKLLSNTRPERLPNGEPIAPTGAPTRPDWVSSDPHALEGWESFIRDVGAIGLLSTTDGHAAAMYAALHSEEWHLTKEIATRGSWLHG